MWGHAILSTLLLFTEQNAAIKRRHLIRSQAYYATRNAQRENNDVILQKSFRAVIKKSSTF